MNLPINKITLPNGMHDKLFKRARVTYEIEHAISDFLIAQGFNRIDTPTLEHFEVFSDQVEPYHYHLFDKKGELLALRPDVTSQIGRVIASTRVHTPTKFSYSGKVFHYHEELRGLLNEQSQAGIEIIGYPAREAVLEAIQSAKQALDLAQVQFYQFEFSHAAVLETVLVTLDLDQPEEDQLLDLIRRKNMTGLYEFTARKPSSFDRLLQELPNLFGLIQGFFRSLPSVLEEASYIDGCGPMRTFFSIMLPLGKPGLIAAAIFNFISLWNEFLLALTFVNDSADYPLSVGLYALQGSLQYTGDWVALFAALVVITLPTLLIYVFLSRQIIEGLTMGAVKG